MKVAVLVFGEYRTFETAIKTWNCKFWDDVDYYMSTWDYSIEPMDRVKHLVTNKWKTDVDENFIKNNLPNVNLKITNSNSKEYIENHDTNKMIYHWKTLYNMVIDSGKEYDCIFLVRPDAYFFIQPSFFENAKKNILYSANEINDGAHDIFFFGYGNLVLDFLKNIPSKMNNIHTELATYLKDNFKNDFLKTNDGYFYGLLRPTSVPSYISLTERPLEKDDLNPNFIQNDFIKDLKYTNSRYDLGLLNVLLIGESCDDKFIYGNVDRLSPEAPIPVLNPKTEITSKGMAGNVNRQFLELYGNLDFTTNESVVTKTRYVDNSTNYILLRVDEGDENIEKINLDNLPDKVYDVIIFSDYDKGFISESDIKSIIDYYKQKTDKLLTFIDTKKDFDNWIKNLDYIKVNYKEYIKNKNFIDENPWISEKLIVTRGPFGCDYNGKNYPNKEVPIKDLSGAGDTFLSALVAKYIVTNNIESSIEYANKLSELVVQKRGVSLLEREEIVFNLNKKNELL